MAELERLANHLGDIGAICNDAAFALMLPPHCGILREEVLRAAKAAFGHRLMMDRIIPGGVTSDLDDIVPIKSLTARIRQRFPRLVELYDNTASLQNRTVSTGRLSPELARRFGVGGPVGRASGRAFDARKAPGYPPYSDLDFKVAKREDGDVDARIWVRIDEVYECLELIEQNHRPAAARANRLSIGTGTARAASATSRRTCARAARHRHRGARHDRGLSWRRTGLAEDR